MTDSRMRAMLAVFCATTFVVTASGSATAPFLPMIAAELSSTVAKIAHLFSVQALTWGTTALVAGALSDRLGRRSILVGGVVLLGVTRLGFATSQSYEAVISWQLISGLGGGAFMGTVFATVSDHVPAGQRGRALSWVITGQSLSLVLGVPLIALLGAAGGWRGAIAAHGVAVLMAAIAARLATPADMPHPPHTARARTPLTAFLKPKLFALLAAGTMERLCFASLAIYLATYLHDAYGISLGGLALALALVALGNLAGNLVGGRIADRTRSRQQVFAVASALTAVLAVPTLMWAPGLSVSVALGFAYSFVNAAGRPSLMATLAEMPNEIRGALFGLNITSNSLGWLLAGSAGGWLIATGGFVALGTLCAGAAVLGSALALASAPARPESSP